MISRIEIGKVPDLPGSYQFKDADGRVIYVGKAKSLRQRLASYMQSPSQLAPKVASMVHAAESVEWITVENDVEAIMLEYSLIKRFRPRFNVRLRDDKSYPYVVVTADQSWPRAAVTRQSHRRSWHYFGPYAEASAIRETLDLLVRTFRVRTCSDAKFSRQAKLGRPCLLYHIERCSGPCIGAVEPAAYSQDVAGFESVLRGRSKGIEEALRQEMARAASEMEFEAAARIRDRLAALTRVVERQEMVGSPGEDLDVIGVHADELECLVEVLNVRGGRVSGRRSLVLDRVEELENPELLERVVEELYGDSPTALPPEILVPWIPANLPALVSWLEERRGGRVRVRVPQRGHGRALADRARGNAEESFKRHRLRRASDHSARARALTALADELELPLFPLRIECYDMSHLGGSNYVGSMVVMEDGIPKKADYRRFKVNVGQNDDFAAMHEVLSRRLARLNHEDDEEPEDSRRPARFSYPPSLIVVDGGKGQLTSAHRALVEAGLDGEIPMISLAKKFEEVYLVGRSEPVRIPRTSEALFLLQQIRDEAHRFAITYHRSLRDKAMTRSILDEVPGLGPVRRKKLLTHFGSLKRVRTASKEEIASLGWLPEEVGHSLYAVLHPGPGEVPGRGGYEPGKKPRSLGAEQGAGWTSKRIT